MPTLLVATTNKAITNVINNGTKNSKDNKIPTTSQLKTAETLTIQSLKLFDNLGTLRKSFKYANGTEQVHLNVHDLLPGIYYIEVFNGTTYQRTKLLIQR